ncbi:leucine-rich repeat serine/threonine-protein kinase 1-like [Amphiura filiformis]|uniref:leucine-rich repeat serine/threonine-protein kinase 1-like n=1 Tax=Amphiura filiformis TaxID=82378 RepID=UPI003B2257F8
MEQNALDGFNVPTKPGGWVPPAPRMVPRTQAPADSKEHPQCPGSGPINHSQYSVYHLTGPTRHSQYSPYPATGPPPPAQAIHTQDPTVYQPDDDYPPASGQHTVVIIDGYTQQQRQEHTTQCYAADKLIQCIQDGSSVSKIFEYLNTIPRHAYAILFDQPESEFNRTSEILEKRKDFLPEACDRELKHVVLTLLERGSNPSSRGSKGTSLEVSTTKGNKEIIEAIIKFEPGGHKAIAKQVMQQLWTEDESTDNFKRQDASSETLKYSRKLAKWSKRHLPYFDSAWLNYNNADEFLVDIDLSGNSLFNINGDLLWGLPLLETLKLSDCMLRKVPDIKEGHYFASLSLQKLDLSNNRLRQVPADLFMIRTLRELNLEFNVIQTIDAVSESFQQNTKCETHGLPWDCQSLKTLNMANTQLRIIPNEIQSAKQLTILNVNNCRLTHLPRSWECPLKTIKASKNQLITVEDMSNWRRTLKTVDLSQNKLMEFPETVCQLFAVEEINVSHNEIQRLPEVHNWKTYRLRILDVSYNKILSLHRDLKERLMKEKSSRGKQREWKRITKLRTVPDWLLDVSLDDNAGQCVFPTLLYTRLKELDLSFNRIQKFPETVCRMRTLQVLQISGNPFMTRLPEQLGLLSDLFTFNLDFENIQEPVEVVQVLRSNDGGGRATPVVKVLKEKYQDYQPYNGVKVMMIGPRESGKTTLFRLLAGDQTGHEHKNDDVVCVHRWGRSGSIPGSWIFSQQIEFTVWDLRGGDENTVISQTLFTPNTIYLLVWNANKLEEKLPEIRKWMLNVKLLAPGCGIIGVGTYAIHSPSKDMTLSNKLSGEPFLKRILGIEFQVDLNNPRSPELKALSQTLAHYTMNMTTTDIDRPHGRIRLIGRKVPRAFLEVKHQLEEELSQQIHYKRPCFLTEETFRQINSDKNKATHSSRQLKFVIDFLREAGSLIHVSDHTYRLTSLYFLDPNWLCKVLLSPIEPNTKKALDRQRHRTRRIGVPRDELQICCQSTGFGEERFEEFLELLGRFEIAILETSDSYFLPDLDPEDSPVVEEREEDTLKTYANELIRLYKTNYLAPGFLRRLLSRILADTRKNKHASSLVRQTSRTLTWKKGIDITNDHNHIEVELVEHEEDGRNVIYICLSVQSDSKEDVAHGIGFLTDHVEYLLKEWYADIMSSDRQEAVERFVPCPICIHAHRKSMTDIISKCHKFEFTGLTVAAIVEKKDSIECHMVTNSSQAERLIPLKDVVPDLFLLDLNVDKLNECDINISDIKLGEGSFGIVFKANIGEESVALKSLLKQDFNDDTTGDELIFAVIEQFPDFRREIATMSRLQHPCILQMVGVYVQKLMFAMEFAPHGDLGEYIDDNLYIPDIPGSSHQDETQDFVGGTALNRLLTFKIAYQIIAAVDYLH